MTGRGQLDDARALRAWREKMGDHLSEEQRFARERVRKRIVHRRGGSGPSVSLPIYVLRRLFVDADRAEALAREVAWYRARLERSAWYPVGDPLPTDEPVQSPPDQRPLIEI